MPAIASATIVKEISAMPSIPFPEAAIAHLLQRFSKLDQLDQLSALQAPLQRLNELFGSVLKSLEEIETKQGELRREVEELKRGCDLTRLEKQQSDIAVQIGHRVPKEVDLFPLTRQIESMQQTMGNLIGAAEFRETIAVLRDHQVEIQKRLDVPALAPKPQSFSFWKKLKRLFSH